MSKDGWETEALDRLLKLLAEEAQTDIALSRVERPLPQDFVRQTIIIRSVESLSLSLAPKGPSVSDNLSRAKGLFYFIIAVVAIVALAFIFAGLGLVYLGASGHAEVALFNLRMTSTNVGVISIAFGALVMIMLLRKAMHHINEILKFSSSRPRSE